MEYQNNYWYIYDNEIYSHDNYAILSQDGDNTGWHIWNNIMYDNLNAPGTTGCHHRPARELENRA